MTRIYEIGPFRLDTEAGVLSHDGRPMALGARGVAVLAALVEQPNEYVRKESILDAAWSGVVVEEGNLAVQISSIRRALAQTLGANGHSRAVANFSWQKVAEATCALHARLSA